MYITYSNMYGYGLVHTRDKPFFVGALIIFVLYMLPEVTIIFKNTYYILKLFYTFCKFYKFHELKIQHF